MSKDKALSINQAKALDRLKKSEYFISKHTDRLRRVFKGGTRKDSIEAYCLDCEAYSIPNIRFCTNDTCPLWNHRPYQKKRS